ncbi:hypothetical protein PybrP1_007056 [[Pythium] brassicae (nom. inval.)]|nr:hypothetical protein PybrP1_007056 [[Pythium] brassicae (nom. inval.)]
MATVRHINVYKPLSWLLNFLNLKLFADLSLVFYLTKNQSALHSAAIAVLSAGASDLRSGAAAAYLRELIYVLYLLEDSRLLTQNYLYRDVD